MGRNRKGPKGLILLRTATRSSGRAAAKRFSQGSPGGILGGKDRTDLGRPPEGHRGRRRVLLPCADEPPEWDTPIVP